MNPLVSVIIPVYNLGKHLQHCYESVAIQTYRNLEILLVNDGSTDDSLNICYQIADLDNRVKVIEKKNGGVSSARNAGLDNAHGEYIAFIDGDDIIAPFYIEELLNGCGDSVLSVCMHERINTYTHSFKKTDNLFRKLNTEKCCERVLKGHFPISTCACIFLNKSIGMLRFPVGIRNNEDKLFIIKFLLNNSNERVTITQSKMYGYYVREGSATRTVWDGSLDIIQVADEIYDLTLDQHPEWETYAKLNKIGARIDTLKLIVRSSNKSKFVKDSFSKIKKEVLSLGYPSSGGRTLKAEYIALKLGNTFFVMLVKSYYMVMNDQKRFKRNEEQIKSF